MQVLDVHRDSGGGYKVDVSRGERVGRVSSEWFSRPADERYLSLNELMDSVRNRTERSRTRIVESATIRVEAAGWRPSIDSFLGRVTKARILQAVAEAKGQRAADRIEHLKKGDMAAEAEALLAETNWLPEPLRTRGLSSAEVTTSDGDEADATVEESAEDDGRSAMADEEPSAENEPADAPQTIAAE